MIEILRTAAGIGTPIALLAFVAALGYFAYSRRMKYEEKKLEALPPEERARRTDEFLTRYRIDGSNLRIEDKVSLIRDEMNKRHRRSLVYVIVAAAVAVICFGLAVFAKASLFGLTPAHEEPKPSSLLLRMDKPGQLVVDDEKPEKGAGFVFEFTLSNATRGLTLVDEIAVEVLDVIEDKAVVYGAAMTPYKYEVSLKHTQRGLVPFAKAFKYSPNEVDRFSVNVIGESGYDYFIRFVVKWYDAVQQKSVMTASDIQVVRLPALPTGDEVSSADKSGKRYEQQTERIQARLRQLRAGMSK